jgi:hypothetical protein
VIAKCPGGISDGAAGLSIKVTIQPHVFEVADRALRDVARRPVDLGAVLNIRVS